MFRSFKKNFILFSLLVAIFLFFGDSLAGQKLEKGWYPIRYFSPDDYNALPQNWAVIQDDRDILYFANGDGIMEYDGSSWRIISSNENLVRSFAIDEKGKIFVGALNEFGYLAPSPTGLMEYHSLTSYLPDSLQKFGDIWTTHYHNQKIYFQTDNYIFIYAEDSVRYVKLDQVSYSLFKVHEQLYLTQRENGVSLLKNDKLMPLSGADFFADKRIFMLLPYEDGQMLAVTNEHGMYRLLHENGNSLYYSRFRSAADPQLNESQVYHGIPLDDHRYSLGTFNGIQIIDQIGDITYWLSKETGLVDEKVLYQYLDNQNHLWLASSNGISRVEIHSPITYFNDLLGVNGTVESIVRHEGTLYIATSTGVYYLESFPGNQHIFPAFKPVEDIRTETWIVTSLPVQSRNILLVEENQAIVQVNSKTKKATSIFEDIPWEIHQSKQDPTKVFIGVEDGVYILQYQNQQWEALKKIENIDRRISSISEDDAGNMWLSSYSEGFYNLSPTTGENEYEITYYDTAHGLPEGPFISIYYEQDFLFGTANGLYRFDQKNQTFTFDTLWNNLISQERLYIHRMSEDSTGNLWLITYSNEQNREIKGYISNKEGLYSWVSVPFLGNITGTINAIYHDQNGVTWLGGNEGLFRFDINTEKDYEQKYHTLIREVSLGEDSTIFYGTNYDENGHVAISQPEALKYTLKYAYNSLIFEYSAPNIDIGNPTLYSHYLEGYDKRWSEWTEETKKEYTNLPEGDYIFRVKAKNVYNNIAEEARFEFYITPPWYRTWAAYIGYVLGLVSLIYLIVTQYTKYLRQIIKENTAEIRAQKEEIEAQKEEITDSIKYAQRIQKAICPSDERAEELLPEHFVLWRPRDIVSGDYWWMTEKEGKVALVAADCTGHGVPGAFMSMLGVSFLNEIANKMDGLHAGEILNQLRANVKTTLKQTGKEGEQKDGMDLAIVIIDQKNMKIQYAGAYNPLYLYRNGELLETKADKNPIGIYIKELDSFTNHDIEVQKGDTFYIFSDGFPDQFGGEKGGKFKTKRFKELLADIQNLPMKDQKEMLNQTIDAWRGDIEQVDDIIVVGIRM